MNAVRFDTLEVGSQLPSFAAEPLSRLTLALYAGASGDHNPIHVDSDFARRAGMPDVFAHGMLSMAYLGRLLTNWVPQDAIRDFSVRFAAITQVGDAVTCTGVVTEKDEAAGTVRIALSTCNQQGDIKLTGEALIAPGR
ncbi:MaoC family dehydratase [Cupriavidus sp.]|uniref:MaoC family dehydratase n=1 Tax=Cupriavidus sp. TaxID=1873897 RepID=UPI0025B983EF|nr:MaoC family dehydratase [Cupriavidus sp.]MCA3183015.1 MaoC family dehydratase [Cupriavidus sp.]MCA3188916.1 MaoC family dehydratase [Cupriavidus sp.]MCA3198636.1 MaoC family dehydratase [Cupriavidus sp.]MCA3201382.1 MaoC family dehydratase [Cupriavidus sp.]MCA3209775.1 MaoC family dehydratase [Cupriavidus sp.]